MTMSVGSVTGFSPCPNRRRGYAHDVMAVPPQLQPQCWANMALSLGAKVIWKRCG